jgi:hypothetical protein
VWVGGVNLSQIYHYITLQMIIILKLNSPGEIGFKIDAVKLSYYEQYQLI